VTSHPPCERVDYVQPTLLLTMMQATHQASQKLGIYRPGNVARSCELSFMWPAKWFLAEPPLSS
jgi:hypothetical protein